MNIRDFLAFWDFMDFRDFWDFWGSLNFWDFCSYSAGLRTVLSMCNFCAVYFATLLGRCALLSFPVLGLALLLRQVAERRSVFAKGAVWAVFAPVPFLGKLAVYYESRRFLPFALWQSWCSGFWWVRYGYLAGVAVCLALTLHRRLALRRALREFPAAEVKGQRVSLCPFPVSPFAAGLFAPKIVLPAAALERLSDDELHVILLHERTHIRLGHLWRFLLWDILCALFWVNPLLRLYRRKLNEDMEQICDAVTIRHSGRDALFYGTVLLKCLRLPQAEGTLSPAAFAGEREFHAVRRRICRVRDYRPYRRRSIAGLWLFTAGALLAAAFGICRLSLPRYIPLEGFSVVYVSEAITFSTVYESDGEAPPLSLAGGKAEIDNAALRALLPEDAPRNGWYYLMWGGFLKLPGIGGALNSVYLDTLWEQPKEVVEFSDVNELLYVRFAKWI